MRTKEDALAALRPVGEKGLTEVQKQAMLRLQVAVEEFNHAIFDNVPECADRTAAVRHLLDCKMTCVQAITHTGFEKPQTKEKKDGYQKANEAKDQKAAH